MNGILLTDENELDINVVRNSAGLIESGLTIGNIDYQRVKMIMAAQKGEFKEYPTLGFGIESYLKMPFAPVKRQKFINNLTTELLSDGIKAKVTVGKSFMDLKVEI